MIKVSGGASCFGRNVAARECESPTSTEIAKHVYVTNDNTERTERTQRAAGGLSQPKQTQQRHIRSLSDLAGLEFTRKAQQESQQVNNEIILSYIFILCNHTSCHIKINNVK